MPRVRPKLGKATMASSARLSAKMRIQRQPPYAPAKRATNTRWDR